jgi:adenine-specific DNA methylase
LEPTAGDGAILDELALLGSPTAVELIQEEAEKAQRSSGVKVHVADFFHWFTNSMPGSFDGVAGNPPYIRFGNWEEEYRAAAFDYMENLGLRPTRLTNAWLPFVVASVMAARRGGRVGLVLPAELLQVDYARQVRSFLIDNCSDITVISFSQLVFPGILQEVVLLLAVRGEGPALMRGIEVETAEDLKEVQLDTIAIQAPLHESEKWTKYYLQPQQIELLRRFKKTIDCLDLVISLRLTLE